MGGGFSLFHDQTQLILITEIAIGDLGIKFVPDEAEMIPLDLLIQARNLQIDISNWNNKVQGTHMLDQGDWWLLDYSQLEKLSGIWIPNVYEELMVT